MEREAGGGIGMGNTCKSMADSVNVWQKPLQHCKVISLQLIKINGENKLHPGLSRVKMFKNENNACPPSLPSHKHTLPNTETSPLPQRPILLYSPPCCSPRTFRTVVCELWGERGLGFIPGQPFLAPVTLG